ncbi:MAG: GNAT family N-acetyltransferase [Candidatus Aenigmarchaeota archaeon]|nr:GNAT family N-acetyltransferase [Candidatus Aenigmarchaeota archaeon]
MSKTSKIPIHSDDIEIVPINYKHNECLIDFKTEITELKSFLIEDALDNQKQKISLTFLWFYKDQLIGYVSLLNDKINLEGNLKTYFKEKDVLYKSLPALKVGRLCVHDSFRRMGFGRLMVIFVIQKAELIGNTIAGCRFITLDAKRNVKKELDSIYFYKRMGFKVLKGRKKGTIPMYFDLKID